MPPRSEWVILVLKEAIGDLVASPDGVAACGQNFGADVLQARGAVGQPILAGRTSPRRHPSARLAVLVIVAIVRGLLREVRHHQPNRLVQCTICRRLLRVACCELECAVVSLSRGHEEHHEDGEGCDELRHDSNFAGSAAIYSLGACTNMASTISHILYDKHQVLLICMVL